MNERYARHSRISGWDQARLSASSVCIAGMGALGNEVSRLLVMAGVGRLIISDPDTVEESNLSRTLLFKPCDIGRMKVAAAADSLRLLFPSVEIDVRPEPLINGIGLAELRDADLVLGCLDSRSARLQLSSRCFLVGARLIDGGTHPWGGEVRLFLDPDGACYGCGFSPEERTQDDVPWSCMVPAMQSVEGAAAPSSALVGAWMASMAIRFLMDLSTPNNLLVADIPRGLTTVTTATRDPDCPYHHPAGTPRLLGTSAMDSVAALKAELGPATRIFAWDAIQYRAECPRDDFRASKWQRPSPSECPKCGSALRIRTTLDLSAAPDEAILRELGIAPRELLFATQGDQEEWVELR
jgi:molybdopterin/thiamine biosynthesis adenylyltransferase